HRVNDSADVADRVVHRGGGPAPQAARAEVGRFGDRGAAVDGVVSEAGQADPLAGDGRPQRAGPGAGRVVQAGGQAPQGIGDEQVGAFGGLGAAVEPVIQEGDLALLDVFAGDEVAARVVGQLGQLVGGVEDAGAAVEGVDQVGRAVLARVDHPGDVADL